MGVPSPRQSYPPDTIIRTASRELGLGFSVQGLGFRGLGGSTSLGV